MELLQTTFTSFLSAFALFIIAKITGHKQMAQLDFFDYITGITIGSIAAELATELEEPLKPLIAMIIYGLVAFGLTILAHKFPKTRKYVNGTPTIVMDNGKLFRKNMKKAKLELSEFLVLCRQAGYFNLDEIQTAIFEYNGRISILPKSEKRPLTPEDVNRTPEKAKICTEVIMDGRILDENLNRLGLNLTWLNKQLKQQKIGDAKEIYLGICDKDNNLSLYKMD